MKLCRYIITPVSPWSGELRSDTLYGLICWYVAESEGAAACSELIEGFSAGRPPFKLSSAMPADFLPMPSLPPISRKRFRELVEKSGKDEHGLRLFSELQKFKKFRKKSWLPLSTWQQHKGRLSTEALFLSQREDRREEEKTSPIAFEPHVSINRNTGSAQEGQLFFMRLRYFTQGTKLHLYAQAEDPAYLLKYLRLIGELGFGKDAGTGHQGRRI